MSAVPYWQIREEIAEIIKREVPGTTVEVEKEIDFSVEQSPWVGIYLPRRSAPEPQQTLAAGQRTYMELSFSIWVFCHALELALGIKQRDETIGNIELALMRYRSLNETVDSSWLEGGELVTARDAQTSNWLAGGEILLTAVAIAIVE